MKQEFTPSPGAIQRRESRDRTLYLQSEKRALEEWYAHRNEPSYSIRVPGTQRESPVSQMSMTEEEYRKKIENIDRELSQRIEGK